MKRIIAAMLVCVVLLPLLAGCCLRHDWQAATCEAPETCAKCGATQGEALGHTWQAATCEAPETCAVCGATQGEALGHELQAATCETPEICTVCGATLGEALGHAIRPAAIEEGNLLVGTCTNCNTEIRQTIVREEYADSFLPGEWECIGYQTSKGEAYAPEEGDHIVFYEDHTFSMQFVEKEIAGRWVFKPTDEEQPLTIYDCEILSSSTGRMITLQANLLDKAMNSVIMTMASSDTVLYCVYNRK